jgi:E3 ubiquitin-protein ligase RNF216
MDPGGKPPDPWSLREHNARVVTAERSTKRKAPFIPPEDIIELTDSSDDESIRPRKLATTFNASLPRIEPLFLPASDDDEPKNVPPAPGAQSEGSNVPAMHSVDAYVAQVLEIVPDVEPLHVTSLVQRFRENVLEQVLHLLFENPDYPKTKNKGKGKRKRTEEDEGLQAGPPPSKTVKIDYASKNRHRLGGTFYDELSIVSQPPGRTNRS